LSLDALWHDLECGPYGEDLPLWRALAAEAGGPVLDVGAGTGRVTLDLASHGVPVVAVDVDGSLLETLERRAAGLPVATVAADAREIDLGRRFPLVIVPMQTLQLLGGREGRAAFLRRALAHLEPGGLLAVAVADPLECFDEDHDLPPPPDVFELDRVRYASRLLSVVEDDGRAAIHRRRYVIGPADRFAFHDAVIHLDRVLPDRLADEAAALGFRVESPRFVPETEEYLGSTVVMLSAARQRQEE